MNLKRYLLVVSLVLSTLFTPMVYAQSDSQPDALFKTIQTLDAKLFDAYNHCDLTTLGAMVSDDLEFYHDQTGLEVGKALFLAAIKQNIPRRSPRVTHLYSVRVTHTKNRVATESLLVSS
jgi:hypothetical protein